MTKLRMWTKEEVQFLKDNRHLSNKELGDILNRPYTSVRQKKHLEGIKKYDIDWKKELTNNNHLTQSELADILGVNQSTVRQQVKKHGIKLNARSYNKYLEYEEYLLNNYGVKTYKEMADELGLSRQQVHNYLLDNRIIPLKDEYAMYRGDEYIGEGTFYELSEISDIKPSMIKWHSYNLSNKRQIDVFKLDDDDMDDYPTK